MFHSVKDSRLGEFVELYPDINLTLITTDEELDLAMREADVAIRLRQPTQPDLIQRKLFSVRFHAYASPEYIKHFGTPRALDDLDNHRVLLLGGSTVPNSLENRRWLIEVAQWQRPAHSHAHHQHGARRPARLPAGNRGRAIAGLSGRGEWRIGAAIWRIGDHRARRLFRLSRGIEVGRSRPGISRFPGRESAALAFLSSLDATARSFRGAAPILHRADQNDPKNETEDQQQRE